MIPCSTLGWKLIRLYKNVLSQTYPEICTSRLKKSFTWVHTWNTRKTCQIVSPKHIRIWFVRCNFSSFHYCYELYKALKSRHHAILTDVAIIYALNSRAREGLMKSSVVILASVLLEGEVWRSPGRSLAGLTLVSAFVCDYQKVYNHNLFLTNFVRWTAWRRKKWGKLWRIYRLTPKSMLEIHWNCIYSS